jgi:hypothetical protein
MSTSIKKVPQILAAATRPMAEEATPIYHAVAEAMGLNPETRVPLNYVHSFATSPTKRERQRAGKLTQRVWDSLLPDGTVDPTKAVPISAVTTQELPQIGGDNAV